MDGMSERVSLKFLSCSASKYIIIVVFYHTILYVRRVVIGRVELVITQVVLHVC